MPLVISPSWLSSSPEIARSGGRLAGAVGAEQGDDLAVGDFDRQAAQHEDDLVVDDFDVGEFEHVTAPSVVVGVGGVVDVGCRVVGPEPHHPFTVIGGWTWCTGSAGYEAGAVPNT